MVFLALDEGALLTPRASFSYSRGGARGKPVVFAPLSGRVAGYPPRVVLLLDAPGGQQWDLRLGDRDLPRLL